MTPILIYLVLYFCLIHIHEGNSYQHQFSIHSADFKYLPDAAYLMTREKFKVPSVVTAEHCKGSAHSNEIFREFCTNELRRLEQNFPSTSKGSPHRVLCAVDNNGQLVGYIDVDKRFRTHGTARLPPPFVCDLVIHPAWRRKGVAGSLLRSAEEVCSKEWNEKKVFLLADCDNKAATTLYLKKGYRPVQVEQGPYFRVDKTEQIRTIIEKSDMKDRFSSSVIDAVLRPYTLSDGNTNLNRYNSDDHHHDDAHNGDEDDLQFWLAAFAATIAHEWDRVLFMKDTSTSPSAKEEKKEERKDERKELNRTPASVEYLW